MKCTGRGSYQRTRLDCYGFPRGKLTRKKQHFGFQTGDMVRAEVPTGKKAGTHVGRVVLPSGKVLVAGGLSLPPFAALSSAELFDPATGTWSATGSLNQARQLDTATLLPDGKVLAAGGKSSSVLSSAELYDPAAGTWSPSGSLSHPRDLHTATLLSSGNVLVAGGAGPGYLSSSELFH